MSPVVDFGRVLRSELPRCPPDIADAVEMFARKSGRHAKVHFVPFGGWFARFTLRPDDRRMKAFQEGMAAEPPGEDIWFHIPNPREGQEITAQPRGPFLPLRVGERHPAFLPLDIPALGVSGVTEFLEKGDTWSGRGEFDSIVEQARVLGEKNRVKRAKIRDDAKEEAVRRVKDTRRVRFRIPFVPVGIDLTDNTKE